MRSLPCIRQSLIGLLCTGILAWTSAGQAAPAQQKRAVALAPHIVELMFAAGAGDALVAVVDGSNFPPAALSLPSLGDGLRLSAEQLLLIQPDVVLAWQAGPVRTIKPLLDQYQVDLVFSDPTRLSDIADEIDHFGRLFDSTEIARPAAAALRARIEQLRERYAAQTPVRVFIQLGLGPIYSLGPDSIVNDALRVCGAINVLGETRLTAPLMSVESVLSTSPDAILSGTPDGEPDLALRAFWAKHAWPRTKIEADRFIALPADALYRATPRLIDATETLCKQVDAIRHAL